MANPFGQRNDGGQCTCSDCGLVFTGLTGFDLHLIPEHPDGSVHQNPQCKCSDWWPRCRSEEELRALGYVPNAWGRWGHAGGHWMALGGTETAVGAEGGQG